MCIEYSQKTTTRKSPQTFTRFKLMNKAVRITSSAINTTVLPHNRLEHWFTLVSSLPSHLPMLKEI